MSESVYVPPSCPSNTIWIIMLIILFLVVVGLAGWLIYLYTSGKIGNQGGTADVVTLGNPRITVSADSVTGSWGALTEATDRVTLFVSEKPFTYAANGTVIVNPPVTSSQFATGPNNSVMINVGNTKAVNAMLIASREGTVAIKVYGPIKVFTQVEANLNSNLFTIGDLNTCTGAISTEGTYAVQTPSVMTGSTVTGTNSYGVFRLGSNLNTNSASTNFLVRYDNDPVTATGSLIEPVQILCRNGETDQIGLKVWVNSTDTMIPPIICPMGTTGTTCPMEMQTPLDRCQWSYNSSPEAAAGQNKWCLSSLQSNIAGASTRQIGCLSHTGSNLILTPLNTSDNWINLLTGTQSAVGQ